MLPKLCFPLSDPLRSMILHDTRTLTAASLSNSLKCNLWCLRYQIFIWGVNYMGQELQHYFCVWSLHSLQLDQRLSVNPMEVHQDPDYPKLIYFLGYFPAHMFNFGKVMDLMNLLCSNWLSQ